MNKDDAAIDPSPRKRGRPRKDASAPTSPEAPPAFAPAVNLFEGYVGEADVAAQRGISLRHLRSERSRGGGPPYVRIGRVVRYSVDGFRAWLAAQEVKPGDAGKDTP